MNILIIICSHELLYGDILNIARLFNTFKSQVNVNVDYCVISSTDNFKLYEGLLPIKYKIVNPKKQMSKICDFISSYKNSLNYDWYIKTRPDIELLDIINFNKMSKIAINARARIYIGEKRIKNGMSIGGVGCWKNETGGYYDTTREYILLDDMFYIFHHDLILGGAFEPIDNIDKRENEWFHTETWASRRIMLNVVGIFLENTKHHGFSGDLNLV